MNTTALLFFIFILIAIVSSYIGLGGATFYLAFMELFQLPYLVIPILALSNNVVVCGLSLLTAFLHRQRIPLPFLIRILLPALIFVYLGASIAFSDALFRLILSTGVLLALVLQMLMRARPDAMYSNVPRISGLKLLGISALIGFLSGIIGIGGGIVLGPILHLRGMKYIYIRPITSAYIFLNSIVGIYAQSNKWLAQMTMNEFLASLLPYAPLFLAGALGSGISNIFTGKIIKERYIRRTVLAVMIVISMFNLIRAGVRYDEF